MRQFTILLLFSTLLLSNACRLPDSIVSPGRVDRSSISSDLQNVYQTCDSIKGCEPSELEIIGHGAGSYRYYPMDIKKGVVQGNGWKGQCVEAKDINDLMDLSFSDSTVNSIEIDIQAAPEDHFLCTSTEGDCLFILHDNQKKWKCVDSPEQASSQYLMRNTLRSSLAHFIEKGYYKDKHLYIELKSVRGCMKPDCTKDKCTATAKRVALEISDELEQLKTLRASNSKNCISIISFSASSLQTMYDSLPAHLRDEVDYVLIAGIQRFGLVWIAGQLKGVVPIFNDDLRKFAATTKWLDRVWFSVRGLKDFNSILKELNTLRAQKCPGCDSLEYSMATYEVKPEEFHEKMEGFSHPLPSVMIDIDDDRPKRND